MTGNLFSKTEATHSYVSESAHRPTRWRHYPYALFALDALTIVGLYLSFLTFVLEFEFLRGFSKQVLLTILGANTLGLFVMSVPVTSTGT